jgi:hypothetical protein
MRMLIFMASLFVEKKFKFLMDGALIPQVSLS